MGVSRASSGPIRFGPFEVDSNAGELRKQGVKVKLQEQPLQILQLLLERAGEVVTREELQQRLWPADTFVDFDHGLYNAIKRLREALGDTADTPRFIETLPKRGYRFIAPLNGNGALGKNVPPGDGTADALPARTTSSAASRAPWFTPTAAVVSVGVIVGLAFGFNAGGLRNRIRQWGQPPMVHSLAVLPLKNLSQDPAQEYFSYGMTEELITDLAQISGLKVISHTSVIQYENGSKPLPQIARELGVDGIVEGAVQRSGNRVRITAQLIYAPEEQHLWAQSYDRDFQDVLALQSSIATAIVESIRAKTVPSLSAPQKGTASPSLGALEDYLQGKYALDRMSSGEGYEGYKAAIQYFNKAISEDPNFAPAYMGLVNVYGADFEAPWTEKLPLINAALKRVLELDPTSADAHLENASIKLYSERDLPGAESEFKEALRLNPNFAEAHDRYADYLHIIGREEQSRQEAKRAQELDPQGMRELGTLVANGQYDRVIALQRHHLELHPNDGYAYIDPTGLIDAYHFAGRNRESVEALQQAWTLFGFKEIGQGVGKAYTRSGYQGAMRYSAKQLEQLYAEGKVYKPDWIAMWYARAGDKELALKWLRILLADYEPFWPDLDRDPNFIFLHGDPRFQELVKRASLH